MKQVSVEEIARAICVGSNLNPNKRSVNHPEKQIWELWSGAAREVHKLIYGEKNVQG